MQHLHTLWKLSIGAHAVVGACLGAISVPQLWSPNIRYPRDEEHLIFHYVAFMKFSVVATPLLVVGLTGGAILGAAVGGTAPVSYWLIDAIPRQKHD